MTDPRFASTEYHVHHKPRSSKSITRKRAFPAFGVLVALSFLLGFQAVRGQVVQAYAIKPTITAKMGDMGGKYFGQTPDPAKTRHYYIAAEPDQWDFMPLGSDPICGMTPSPDVISRHVIGKVRYFQYTDATFTERVPETPRLGILGPVLRGVVGDYLEITFLNRTALPLSMHPHGAKYDKDSEGSYYTNNSRLKSLEGGSAAPGIGSGCRAQRPVHLRVVSG